MERFPEGCKNFASFEEFYINAFWEVPEEEKLLSGSVQDLVKRWAAINEEILPLLDSVRQPIMQGWKKRIQDLISVIGISTNLTCHYTWSRRLTRLPKPPTLFHILTNPLALSDFS